MANIYNISADQNFLENLAKGILERFGDGAFGLADSLVLLPNRRSCLYLKEEFRKINSGKAVILPKIKAISDVDEEEITILSDDFDLQEGISKTERTILLSNLIKKHFGKDFSIAKAVNLSSELISFVDEMEREGVSFNSLAEIVPHELAEHWQLTLNFLAILSSEWPNILEEKNFLNPIDRRNKLIEMQASYWLKNPPAHPVIIAGSTASTSATLKLIKTVNALPQGFVVLPALDMVADEEYFSKIEADHPQAGLKNILISLNANRKNVKTWVHENRENNNALKLASEVMRPASTTAKWNEQKNINASHIYLSEMADQNAEATLISFIIRDAYEKKKTIALVTNERSLAAQVSSILTRWEINVDDSTGKNLLNSKEAVFFRVIAETIATSFKPDIFLSLLKNPFSLCGYEPKVFRDNTRKFEKDFLRGARISGASTEIISFVQNKLKTEKKNFTDIEWLKKVLISLEPLEAIFSKESFSFREALACHIEVLESLYDSSKIWESESAKELSKLFNELLNNSDVLGLVSALEYLNILENFLASKVYRQNFGTTENISILTPQEARLLQFDVVIMGGFNNGSWPPLSTNIWLSKKMQKEISLLSLEKLNALAGHDFYSLLCSKNVFITRSRKAGSSATTESSFLLRLKTLMKCNKTLINQPVFFERIAESFYIPENYIKIEPPKPNPPVSKRIKKLSVTGFETLMRDPYSIYAEKILRLKPLDEIDEDPGQKDFGGIIHHAIELFTKKFEEGNKALSEQYFLEAGKEAFAAFSEKNSVYSVWWPRYEGIKEEFCEFIKSRDKNGIKVYAETKGSIQILGFEVTAKADRIEVNGGVAAICDFKTGSIPAAKDIEEGYSPQLAIEGVILSENGFNEIGSLELTELFYVKLFGSEKLKEKQLNKVVNKLADAKNGLQTLIKMYFLEETPFRSNPVYEKRQKYNKYEQLARVKEWIFE